MKGTIPKISTFPDFTVPGSWARDLTTRNKMRWRADCWQLGNYPCVKINTWHWVPKMQEKQANSSFSQAQDQFASFLGILMKIYIWILNVLWENFRKFSVFTQIVFVWGRGCHRHEAAGTCCHAPPPGPHSNFSWSTRVEQILRGEINKNFHQN